MLTPADLRTCACWPLNIYSQLINEKTDLKVIEPRYKQCGVTPHFTKTEK